MAVIMAAGWSMAPTEYLAQKRNFDDSSAAVGTVLMDLPLP